MDKSPAVTQISFPSTVTGLNQNDKLHPHSRVEDVALKLVNILNAKTGSVWLIRPEQLQPFNVPDYRLPVKVGYTAANTYLPCYGQHR